MHFPTIFLDIFTALTVIAALPIPTNPLSLPTNTSLSPFTNSSSPRYPTILFTTPIHTSVSTSLTLLSITTTLNTAHYFTTALTPRDLNPDGSVETGSINLKHHPHPDQSDHTDIPYKDMTLKQHLNYTKHGVDTFIADGHIYVPSGHWYDAIRKWNLHLLHPRGIEEAEEAGKVVSRPLIPVNGTGMKPSEVFKSHPLGREDVFLHPKHPAIGKRDNGTWTPLHLFTYHPPLHSTHSLLSRRSPRANATRRRASERRGVKHHEGAEKHGVGAWLGRLKDWASGAVSDAKSEVARLTGGKTGQGMGI